MILKIRFLTLGLMAALLIAAVGASGARATTPQFHCEIAVDSVCWVDAQATATTVLKVNTGSIKCSSLTLVATPIKDFPDYTFNSVAYTGCTAFGVKATVAMNGCDYAVRLTAGGKTPFPATTDIVCAEKQIAVQPVGIDCEVTMGGQVGLEGLKFESGGGSPKDLKGTIAIENLAYSENGSECLKSGGQTNGKFETTLTVKAYRDTAPTEEQIPLYIE